MTAIALLQAKGAENSAQRKLIELLMSLCGISDLQILDAVITTVNITCSTATVFLVTLCVLTCCSRYTSH